MIFQTYNKREMNTLLQVPLNANGHLWKLEIFPQGDDESNADVEHVSIYLVYDGKITETDPVVAKAVFRTNTTTRKLPKHSI